ncbi:MAG: ACP S-malonyltransferase [bacterium]|nr:ACP S-malonyltransferase [bacterium]
MNQTAILFPGQGAQREGMGRDFCEHFPIARQTYEAASEAIDVDLKAISFAEDDPRLHLTEFTQPAILANEIAIYRVACLELGLNPGWFAGHSLGEYAALVAAGALKFSDAVRIVHRRGALMQAAVPPGVGAMAALKLEGLLGLDAVRDAIVSGEVEVANYNSDSQVVISGRATGVSIVRERLKQAVPQLEFVELPVSAPFHCDLMRRIEAPFRAWLDQFDCNPAAAARVLSNFTGRPHSADREELFDNLARQISGAVRWTENMQWIAERSADDVLELGPGRPLGGFFLRQGYTPPPSIVTVRCLRKAAKSRAQAVA